MMFPGAERPPAGPLRRRLVTDVVAAAMLVTMLAAVTAGSAASPPSPPSAEELGQLGIVTKPLHHTEPVPETRARQIAEHAFGEPPPSGPVGAELVMFSQEGSPMYSRPQPAWLFTWDQISPPGGGPRKPNKPTAPYRHMNAIVSAVSGKVLLGFPSR